MTSNINYGAERPYQSRTAAHARAGVGAGFSHPVEHYDDAQPRTHSPEAEDLLRRYLSEIHSYRQLGNVALRELEDRLAALADSHQAQAEMPEVHPMAHSVLMRPSLPETGAPDDGPPSLNQRLRELSAYLHADLTRRDVDTVPAPQPARQETARPAGRRPAQPRPAPAEDRIPRMAAAHHKVTPTAPVLDRTWFEERFAEMRAAIAEQIAENIPAQRIEALEAQFSLLMEKLDARETDRSVAAVEAGLKKLAAYLEDNKQWTSAHDERVRAVEDRLDQLSGLVAQSHAAISATAKGLELVARGTGPQLARATADLVAEKLAPQISALSSREPIDQLSGEIAKLSAQSTQTARGLDERLKQLQNDFDESLERLAEAETQRTPPAAQPESWQSRLGEDEFDDDEYDDKPGSAAQRAARLSAAAAAAAADRAVPQNGEPIRYQIPYGEFLPEDEGSHSRTGLIIVAIILLLASAAMLYLNLRDKSSSGIVSSAWLSHVTSANKAAAVLPPPVTTASTAGAKINERIAQPATTAAASATPRAPAGLWVTSVAGDDQGLQISGPGSAAGVHAASDADPAQAPAAGRPEIVMPVSTGKVDSLRQAAVDGNVAAQFNVGKTYLDGTDPDSQIPVGERLSKAARWFRRAAEQGHAPSQYRLATLYELGQGAPKSYDDAMAWYERAANSGHIKAMHNLAVLSANGNGRSANYVTAAKWFTVAAQHGLRDSQYNLGVLYERGLGVAKDPALAYIWFSLAAGQGDLKGAQKRDELAGRLSGVDLMIADRRIAVWTAVKADDAANSEAPEPPLDQAQPAEPVIAPKMPSSPIPAPQLLQSSWGAQITPISATVAEAQKLLARLGYRPGPADGIPGPRTVAAIRVFEKRVGWPETGEITRELVAKMASSI